MATIDLNLFNVFSEVAQSLSFSATAKKLGVPKSTVSRSVATLEQELGVRLLNRTTRQVALSTAGADLYQRVAPELLSLKTAIGSLAELEDQPSGVLRVTATPDFGTAVLADVVARFVALYPSIEVDLRLTTTPLDLVAEGIDVAIRVAVRPMRDSTYIARQISPLAIQLYAAPTYIARKKAPRHPRDLSDHDWIVFRGMNEMRLTNKGEVAVAKPKGRVACDDMDFVLALARSGAGICALPTFLATPEVEAGRLVRVLPKWLVPSGTLWFVSPGPKNVPRKVAVFRDFLLETLAKKPLGPS